ncbi:MAG: single-stranded DNA-binding protein [Clostridiales bacterium]|nr:single-stranded DNA-binding protein [Clostridiales bacterium]
MLNSVILMGRLVADPELRTTQNGISVTTFRIAVNRSYTRAGEERQADFIDIVAWRQSAEFVCRYFQKGSLIIVQGSLQSRQYEDKNGNKRTAYEVVADRVSFGGPKSDNAAAKREEDVFPKEDAPSFTNATADDFQETVSDEDLPF